MPVSFDMNIINDREVKQFMNTDWPDYTRFAAANTASRVVFLGLKRSEQVLKREFILRNKFIVSTTPGKGALKYERAIPHHNLNKITAAWGSPGKRGSAPLEFLEKQEEGFTNEGPVPSAKQARISKSKQKRIRRKFYFESTQVKRLSDFSAAAGTELQKRVIRLRAAYKQGFGLPGSDQFIYMEDNEYAPGWSAGFYQFSRSMPPRKDLSYPNLRRLYYAGPKTEKKRRARHWMRQSRNTISQADIDRIYEEEFKKSFERGQKKRWRG